MPGPRSLRPLVSEAPRGNSVGMQGKRNEDRGALLRELMAVFDELPPPLREAINYAPEALDPKDLATLCRRHGAANVLKMIELNLNPPSNPPPAPPAKPPSPPPAP